MRANMRASSFCWNIHTLTDSPPSYTPIAFSPLTPETVDKISDLWLTLIRRQLYNTPTRPIGFKLQTDNAGSHKTLNTLKTYLGKDSGLEIGSVKILLIISIYEDYFTRARLHFLYRLWHLYAFNQRFFKPSFNPKHCLVYYMRST